MEAPFTLEIRNPYQEPIAVRLSETESVLVPDYKLGRVSKVTPHFIQEGETLLSISNLYFKKSSNWIAIAEYNKIEDPVILTPGSFINIPHEI